MQRWSLNDLDIETLNARADGDVINAVMELTQNRPGFESNEKIVTIPRYFYRIIGLDRDETAYYKMVNAYVSSIKKLGKLGLVVTEGFSRDVPTEAMRQFDIVWGRLSLMADFEPADVTELLVSQGLFVDFPKPALQQQFRDNFTGLLEYYFELFHDELDQNDFRNVVLYGMYWLRTYVPELMMEFDYTTLNPKVLYFGSISHEEILFLLYLSSLGCDVLFLNPQSECGFLTLDPQGVFSTEVVYYERSVVKKLDVFKAQERVATTAFEASKEVDQMLQGSDLDVYKPWQCIDCAVETATLQTTYDEISILWGTEAVFRPHWVHERDIVTIPNIFAKVSGTNKEVDQYLTTVQKLIEAPLTTLITSFPILKAHGDSFANEIAGSRRGSTLSSVGYKDTKGVWQVDKDRLLKWRFWPYRHLRNGVQSVIAERISDFVSRHRVTDPTNPDKSLLSEVILDVLLGLDESIQNTIQAFDYPKQIPKWVVYNDGQSGPFTVEDAILLTFLASIGIDIVVFNPSGYNDIEEFVNNSLFDRHQLESVQFKLSLSRKHRAKKLFGLL